MATVRVSGMGGKSGRGARIMVEQPGQPIGLQRFALPDFIQPVDVRSIEPMVRTLAIVPGVSGHAAER